MAISIDQAKAKALLVLRAAVRTVWIVAVNIYSVAAFLVLMKLLRPLLVPHAEGLYSYIEGVLFRWLQHIVGQWMYTAGYVVEEAGEDLSELEDEPTLLIANHQSTADVPSLMYALQFHGRVLDKIMWIMDVMFRYSNFGLVSAQRGDFFIQQGKETRHLQGPMLQKHIQKVYLPRKREWIVVFPEGGFLWKQKKSSQAYARKNGLPHLEHCMLPRVGATEAVLNQLGARSPLATTIEENRAIKWVVDVTIAYPKGVPLNLQTMMSGHRPPMTTTLYYRKYRSDQVPSDREGLLRWSIDRFVEKDQLLADFYQTGCFPSPQATQHDPLLETGDSQTISDDQSKRPSRTRRLEMSLHRIIGINIFFLVLAYVECRVVWSVVSMVISVVSLVF